jgi:hypothetical protein
MNRDVMPIDGLASPWTELHHRVCRQANLVALLSIFFDCVLVLGTASSENPHHPRGEWIVLIGLAPLVEYRELEEKIASKCSCFHRSPGSVVW